jgi:hypothetical protein
MRHILAAMSRIALLLVVAAGCRDTPPPAKPKAAPTITRFVPDEVTEKGYRLGMIEGEGFDTKQPVTVWFGEAKAARAAVVAKTKIQVEIPPAPDGSEVAVRVEIAGYLPATAPAKLRYISSATAHDDN